MLPSSVTAFPPDGYGSVTILLQVSQIEFHKGTQGPKYFTGCRYFRQMITLTATQRGRSAHEKVSSPLGGVITCLEFGISRLFYYRVGFRQPCCNGAIVLPLCFLPLCLLMDSARHHGDHHNARRGAMGVSPFYDRQVSDFP